MTRLFVCSSLSAAVMISAARGAGLLGPSDGGPDILVAAAGSVAPELSEPWHRLPAARAVLARFDRVVDLTAELYPFHPSRWVPAAEELPFLRRALGERWDAAGVSELVVDDADAPPAASMAAIFPDAPVSLVSGGLSAFGPPPVRYRGLARRIERLVHPDVLPGVEPARVRGDASHTAVLPGDAVRGAFEAMAEYGTQPDVFAGPVALLVGQDLAAAGVLDPAEEAELHLRMAEAALEREAATLLFCPHPRSLPAHRALTEHVVRRAGVRLHVTRAAAPVECVAASVRPALAVSCSSSALPLLDRVYGIPPVAVGTERLLERLTPYQNPRRIAATVTDALYRDDRAYREAGRIRPLLDAVSYCMQPEVMASLRPRAVEFIGGLPDAEKLRYVKRRRLEALDLPRPMERPRANRGVGRRAGEAVSRWWSGLNRAEGS